MTGPSNPRPEHASRPGVTWETQFVHLGEVVVEDPDSTTPADMNTPTIPPPNRATRRALARAARRKK